MFEKEELSGFCSKKRKKFVHNDKFPIGIRVLAVEDDLTCLWLLDTISLILLLGFWICFPGLVYSDSLFLFIISLILLMGFLIWIFGSVYFCLDFVASLEGSIEFLYLRNLFLCSPLVFEFVVIFFGNFC